MDNVLEKRLQNLKIKLSRLGSAIAEGKYWLTIRNNGIKIKKEKLYKLIQERNQFDNIYNYSDVAIRTNAIEISTLKKEIEWDKETLKDGSADQKKLIILYKEANREYSKLEKRLKKNVNKFA